MIEAVNSVIANASLLRGNAEQTSNAASFASNSANIEAVAQAPKAPYISPYISVDTRYDTAVIQIRNSDTGDVLTQFPSEPTLQSRQRAEALQRAQEAVAERALTGSTDEPTSVGVEAVTVVQAEAPAQSQGAGVAQAAIAALSTGAQAGQVAQTSVAVTA